MKFTKMHGAGNGFLIAESAGEERDWPRIAEAICPRNRVWGADGMMLILPSWRVDCTFFWGGSSGAVGLS